MLTAAQQSATFGFVSVLDERLPQRLCALYVVGSAALGDFSERVSNLDLVAVSDGPWGEADLAVAVAAHGLLKAARPPVVAYVSVADLATDPRHLERPCYRSATRVPSAELVNPFTWQLLASGAVDLRGPDHPEIWDGPGSVRSWANGRLASVWGPRLGHLGGPGSMWFRREVSSVVLDVARLWAAANGDRAVSKAEAVRTLEPQVPGRFQRILRDARGYRAGGRTSMYWGPVERRGNAVELVHELVDRVR